MNFLVSYSSDPRPEYSLSVNMQVGRSSVRKLKLSTASSFSAPENEAALVWVINGFTSGSESLDTARPFRLFLAFTARNH